MTKKNHTREKDLVRYFIIIYWSLFWLMNVVDKIIGGAHLFFVGRDRFAQVERFFDSIGLENPLFANIALVITAGLEVFALVFFIGALYHLITKNSEATRSWFLIGISFTLATFTFFSIGDQVFGDRFTLLEHGIFWCILLVSWVVFLYTGNTESRTVSLAPSKTLPITVIAGVVLTVITSISIFSFSSITWDTKKMPVSGVEIANEMYKFDFPFLGDKNTLEATLKTFKTEHPELKVNYIYTGPSELNTKKKTHMLLFVFTEKVAR